MCYVRILFIPAMRAARYIILIGEKRRRRMFGDVIRYTKHL